MHLLVERALDHMDQPEMAAIFAKRITPESADLASAGSCKKGDLNPLFEIEISCHPLPADRGNPNGTSAILKSGLRFLSLTDNNQQGIGFAESVF